MEDLLELYEIVERCDERLAQLRTDFKQKLKNIFPNTTSKVEPAQTQKRKKGLSSLKETTDDVEILSGTSTTTVQILEETVLVRAQAEQDIPKNDPDNIVETCKAPDVLMPPPLAPVSAATVIDETRTRPQRAAKIKSEMCLKEPSLHQKLRRPSSSESNRVKQEHQQRASQMSEPPQKTSQKILSSQAIAKPSLASNHSNDSVLILSTKTSIVSLLSDDEEQAGEKGKENKDKNVQESEHFGRQLRVKVKQERSSDAKLQSNSSANSGMDATKTTTISPKKAPLRTENVVDESCSTVLTDSTAKSTKKGRKKKITNHKPIKVERFSEISSPLATRTRNNKKHQQEHQQQPQKQVDPNDGSIYENAAEDLPLNVVEPPPSSSSKVPTEVASQINETVGAHVNPTETFCINAAGTTFAVAPEQYTFVIEKPSSNAVGGVMCDATFDVGAPENNGQEKLSLSTANSSMKTALDTTQSKNNSLNGGDEVHEAPSTIKLPQTTAFKAYKIPTRTHELFNPLVESPVKKKVQAFEKVAHAAAEQTKTGRSIRNKANGAHSSTTKTPNIGKPVSQPAVGRFLTPTLSSNITPNFATSAKTGPNSASKAVPFPKITASNLKRTDSTSNKVLSRENSADEFRKGIHQMAEERKKQREQKHLLAAQLRETKERARAERLAKLAQEREEKRNKKQQETELKKRELDEIQNKLRQQEEAQTAEVAKQKAVKPKAIAQQERELLTKMKQQQSSSAKLNKMLPPPPKAQSKYTFEMLHEDDSTDEEGKITHKRPAPPLWSQSHVREDALRTQQYWPTDIIDSFFSVQPMSPDLKLIFPNIDARHLKRNSSALWATPPRYSELPKY